MNLRFALLLIFPLLGYGFLLFHIYDIQLLRADGRAVPVGAGFAALRFAKANRGAIYFTDKSGNLLPAVLNKDHQFIYAVPKVIEDPQEAANTLAPILARDAEELIKIFSRRDDEYELLIKKADAALAQKINELDIGGIYVEREPSRFYPLGPLASQVLGFVGPASDGPADVGRSGLELFYENSLRGERGEAVNGEIKKPAAGKDLVLTIDPNIQIEAERILGELVKEYGPSGGSVIVMDPATGKIIAMGNSPNFDPNDYGKYPISSFLNPAIQEIYEPGSVFKVITMATGIDSGAITPETTYYDTGSITLNGWTIKNFDLDKNGPYGRVSMMKVIERSINTGAVFAQRQTGRKAFAEYVNNFGFGEKTGIGLPGEVAGDLRRLSPKERDVVFATASYGQGVAVTPLGLIRAIAAIANGGNLVRPYVDAELEPQIVKRVISAETARQVAEMMVSAVDKAEVAKIKGYTLAGKTGTAFVPDFKLGGYTENVINTFVGFGPACVDSSAGRPACSPRFIILIKINEPKGAPLAALTVVPAFRNLAQFILNYYEIEPDRL